MRLFILLLLAVLVSSDCIDYSSTHPHWASTHARWCDRGTFHSTLDVYVEHALPMQVTHLDTVRLNMITGRTIYEGPLQPVTALDLPVQRRINTSVELLVNGVRLLVTLQPSS